MDLGCLVSSAENTITTRNSGDETPKKCFRKGDVIYYAKPENINMIRKNDSTGKTDASDARPILESDGHTDTINSGESLFKVFTFEQSSNDEDTEKCIAFWRSVMEKNLTPIKCTIIENTKNPTPPSNQKHQKSLEAEEKKSQASSEDVVNKIHEEYRKMWLSAIREIQKKKLHEIKLTAKARCKMCDSISSSVDEYLDKIDKRSIKKEIKELNNWKSKSKKKQKHTSKESKSRTETNSSSSLINNTPLIKSQHPKASTNAKQTSGESMNKKSDGVATDLEKTKTESSTASFKEKIRKNLVPDTNTYVHKDVIGEKKKDGVYSKWRSNALEESCQCRNSLCSCNINPAIVAIAKTESDTKAAAARKTQQCALEKINQGVKCLSQQCKDGEDQAKSGNDIKNKMVERNAEQKKNQDVKDSPGRNEGGVDQSKSQNSNNSVDDRYTGPKDIRAGVKDSPERNEGGVDQSKSQNSNYSMDDQYTGPKDIRVDRNEIKSTSALLDRKNVVKMRKIRQRNLSLFLQCTCSTSSCDCGRYKEYLSKKPDEDSDWDVPIKPRASPSHIKRSSLEIYRKSFSRNKMLAERDTSNSSVDVRVPENSVSSNENISTEELLPKLYYNEPMTQHHSPKLGRSISLMLKNCRCSNEDCDCYKIETIHREPSKVDYIPYVTPSRTVVKRVDSLELAKRRLSSFLEPDKKSSVQVLYPPTSFGDDSSVLNDI